MKNLSLPLLAIFISGTLHASQLEPIQVPAKNYDVYDLAQIALERRTPQNTRHDLSEINRYVVLLQHLLYSENIERGKALLARLDLKDSRLQNAITHKAVELAEMGDHQTSKTLLEISGLQNTLTPSDDRKVAQSWLNKNQPEKALMALQKKPDHLFPYLPIILRHYKDNPEKAEQIYLSHQNKNIPTVSRAEMLLAIAYNYIHSEPLSSPPKDNRTKALGYLTEAEGMLDEGVKKEEISAKYVTQYIELARLYQENENRERSLSILNHQLGTLPDYLAKKLSTPDVLNIYRHYQQKDKYQSLLATLATSKDKGIGITPKVDSELNIIRLLLEIPEDNLAESRFNMVLHKAEYQCNSIVLCYGKKASGLAHFREIFDTKQLEKSLNAILSEAEKQDLLQWYYAITDIYQGLIDSELYTLADKLTQYTENKLASLTAEELVQNRIQADYYDTLFNMYLASKNTAQAEKIVSKFIKPAEKPNKLKDIYIQAKNASKLHALIKTLPKDSRTDANIALLELQCLDSTPQCSQQITDSLTDLKNSGSSLIYNLTAGSLFYHIGDIQYQLKMPSTPEQQNLINQLAKAALEEPLNE